MVMLAVALGFSALVTSCSVAGDRVGVLGDSITSLDTGDLEAQLGDQFRFTISGNFGKTAEEVTPQAEVMARLTYDQVIIDLGTNDVLEGLLATTCRRHDRFAGEVVRFRPVHPCGDGERTHGQPAHRALHIEGARQFNDALRAYAQGQDRVDVIDWNAAASDHLNNSDPPTSTLTTDSIHPTSEGNRVLNDLYASASGTAPRCSERHPVGTARVRTGGVEPPSP